MSKSTRPNQQPRPTLSCWFFVDPDIDFLLVSVGSIHLLTFTWFDLLASYVAQVKIHLEHLCNRLNFEIFWSIIKIRLLPPWTRPMWMVYRTQCPKLQWLITLFNNSDPHDIAMRCWVFNLNLSLPTQLFLASHCYIPRAHKPKVVSWVLLCRPLKLQRRCNCCPLFLQTPQRRWPCAVVHSKKPCSVITRSPKSTSKGTNIPCS